MVTTITLLTKKYVDNQQININIFITTLSYILLGLHCKEQDEVPFNLIKFTINIMILIITMIIMIAKAEANHPLLDRWSTSNIAWHAPRLSGSLVGNRLFHSH